MPSALDVINLLDDGLAVSPAALAALDAAEQAAGAAWHRLNQRMYARCVVDGTTPVEREGDECIPCHNDAEWAVARSSDV